MITAWRINKAKYMETAFDGMGSKKAGVRWNSIGTCMVYTSESLALATLEASVRAVKNLPVHLNYVCHGHET